jgi:hypothetical protein
LELYWQVLAGRGKDELDRRMMLAMMGEMYHLMGPDGLAQMYREVLEQHGRTP